MTMAALKMDRCYEWSRGGEGRQCRNHATHFVTFDSGDGAPMFGLHSAIRIERTDATRVPL